MAAGSPCRALCACTDVRVRARVTDELAGRHYAVQLHDFTVSTPALS